MLEGISSTDTHYPMCHGNSTSGYVFQENKWLCLPKDKQKNVYVNFINNSKYLELIQM